LPRRNSPVIFGFVKKHSRPKKLSPKPEPRVDYGPREAGQYMDCPLVAMRNPIDIVRIGNSNGIVAPVSAAAHPRSPQLPGLSSASLYRCLRLQGSAQALSAIKSPGGWGRARSPSTAAARTAFSLLVPAERGVRGFQHAAESPQVADAVIEAQRIWS